MRIHKGDLVKIISGDDLGKTGIVKKVITNNNRVIVEGINFILKHLKPSQENPKGARIKKEASIAISNVQPVCKNKSCKKNDNGVRVKMKVLNNKKKVRTCQSCGVEIAFSD